jgi:hypothetical protein
MNLVLGVLLCFTVHQLVSLNEDYNEQILTNTELKEEMREIEEVEQELLNVIKYEMENQAQRNVNIEIEYMKLLNENKDNASATEAMFLNYLLKLYELE